MTKSEDTHLIETILQRTVLFGLLALSLMLVWPNSLGARAVDSSTAAVEFICTPERVSCGWARLVEKPGGVQVEARFSSLAPGLHSIALLDSGACSAASHFDSARLFRLRADATRADDLAPLAERPITQFQTRADGSAHVSFLVSGATLGAGMNSLTAGDGSALAVSPASASEASACGVVEVRPSVLAEPNLPERF